jgi:hypothetical protein
MKNGRELYSDIGRAVIQLACHRFLIPKPV